MKNLFALMVVLSMIFVACGDDCTTCTLGDDTSEVCDNGDGTVTYTEADGSTTTDSTDFDLGIAALVALGATCN